MKTAKYAQETAAHFGLTDVWVEEAGSLVGF
jgi:hypothetical protein